MDNAPGPGSCQENWASTSMSAWVVWLIDYPFSPHYHNLALDLAWTTPQDLGLARKTGRLLPYSLGWVQGLFTTTRCQLGSPKTLRDPKPHIDPEPFGALFQVSSVLLLLPD
jgi:hypothetical protein